MARVKRHYHPSTARSSRPPKAIGVVKHIRTATQAVDQARQYAYRDRRCWRIPRPVDSADQRARLRGGLLQMMGGLIKAGIEIDRKMLNLAVNEQTAFAARLTSRAAAASVTAK